jgi:hypothetical protein
MPDERATVTVDGVTWGRISGTWAHSPIEGELMFAMRAERHMLDRIAEQAAELAALRADADDNANALAKAQQEKDGAYLERNRVVAALAQCFPSGTRRTAIEGWSDDWHGCVFIDLPTGQASWHYHDSHAYLFADLPPYTKPWDGHTTEEKYARMLTLPLTDFSQLRADLDAVRAVEQWKEKNAWDRKVYSYTHGDLRVWIAETGNNNTHPRRDAARAKTLVSLGRALAQQQQEGNT